MSDWKMVAPKYRAIAYDNPEKIIEAYNDLHRINPDYRNVRFLIDMFNEFHDSVMITESTFKSCVDCRKALGNFFKYVIQEWKTK